MKIICLSDLHGILPDPEKLPHGDVLVIAGDICPATNHRIDFQKHWLLSVFSEWAPFLPVRKVIVTPGNHDFVMQKLPPDRWAMPWWTCLIDESCEFEGVRFHGCPWQPEFQDWAFNANAENLAAIHEAIPPCDVLLTHGPPLGYGDRVATGELVGSISLLRAIERINPRLVVTGHIHEGYGVYRHDGTPIVNASFVDEHYRSRGVGSIMAFDVGTALA